MIIYRIKHFTESMTIYRKYVKTQVLTTYIDLFSIIIYCVWKLKVQLLIYRKLFGTQALTAYIEGKQNSDLIL